jgi:hypothetical protein
MKQTEQARITRMKGSDNVRQGRAERKGTNEIRSVRVSGPGYNLCRSESHELMWHLPPRNKSRK